jgi:hypothetical protein
MLWKRLEAKQVSAAQSKLESRTCLQPAPIPSELVNHINPDTILPVVLSPSSDVIASWLSFWWFKSRGVLIFQK